MKVGNPVLFKTLFMDVTVFIKYYVVVHFNFNFV